MATYVVHGDYHNGSADNINCASRFAVLNAVDDLLARGAYGVQVREVIPLRPERALAGATP